MTISNFKTRTSPMSVRNVGFLLERLGQDCHPLQFVRELTQNAIEANQRSGSPGVVVWDVDWTIFDLNSGIKKLCVTDAGDGMTGSEMVAQINRLSSSGVEQAMDGNYGVGAKIAAVTRNPRGLVYLSWKNGQGTMLHLWRNPVDGVYGIRQQVRSDGLHGDYLNLSDSAKPSEIGTHGTRVVLLGRSMDEHTIFAPDGTPSPECWISKYINTRYFRFPEGVTVKAREGWDYPRTDTAHNFLRMLTGQEAHLEAHALFSGTVTLGQDAIAHWWILADDGAIEAEASSIESSGHVAALYRDELYEMATGRSGTARLQQFGVTFGMRQVVIYVEPRSSNGATLTTNTARTKLIMNGEDLPWIKWAESFRAKMPARLAAYIEERAALGSTPDHAKTIRNRIKPILHLFNFQRYRSHPQGLVSISEGAAAGGIAAAMDIQFGGGVKKTAAGKPTPTPIDNIYALFQKASGAPGTLTRSSQFPKAKWISTNDGSREPGLLEDRPARFIPQDRQLLINADFRVFTDMIDMCLREYGGGALHRRVVEDSVRQWYEQALIETVIGVQALQGGVEWSTAQVEAALSEEALTAAVVQRYHVYYKVRQTLGAKLGRAINA